jgi:hypothetical protein
MEWFLFVLALFFWLVASILFCRNNHLKQENRVFRDRLERDGWVIYTDSHTIDMWREIQD